MKPEERRRDFLPNVLPLSWHEIEARRERLLCHDDDDVFSGMTLTDYEPNGEQT